MFSVHILVFQGELRGKRGLVPSNFLEEVTEEGGGEREKVGGQTGTLGKSGVSMEIFTASKEDLEEAKRVIQEVNPVFERIVECPSRQPSLILIRGQVITSKLHITPLMW